MEVQRDGTLSVHKFQRTLIDVGVPMKLLRRNKMRFYETYNKARMSKNFSVFPI
jgi:hypothetical protein